MLGFAVKYIEVNFDMKLNLTKATHLLLWVTTRSLLTLNQLLEVRLKTNSP